MTEVAISRSSERSDGEAIRMSRVTALKGIMVAAGYRVYRPFVVLKYARTSWQVYGDFRAHSSVKNALAR